jgi:hypothetical protein
MHVSTPLRRAALAAASALALGSLAFATPATASPVFTDLDTHLDPFGSASSSGVNCTSVPVSDATPSVPVAENGATASVTAVTSATFGNTGTPTDTGTWNAQATATGKVTSVGGDLRTMDFTAQGVYVLSNALATSVDCTRGGQAGVDLDFTFTVTHAGFLHLNMKNSGINSYGEVYIYQDTVANDDPYIENYGYSQKFNTTTSVLLPPGTYKGYFEGESYVRSKTTAAGSVGTTVHAEFNVAGAQTAAPSGKGGKYVTLGARSCATHNVAASVTGSKKTAKKIKQVKVFVNGAQVAKVKKPSKGKALTVPVADDQAADVTAEVTLLPKKKGAKAKVYEVSASYEACS